MNNKNLLHTHLGFLFILGIVLLLSQSSIAIANGIFNWKPYREEDKFERTFSIQTPAKLEISSGSGDVKILAGEETKIRINARVRVWSSSRDDAKKFLNEIISDPPVFQSDNKVIISRQREWEWRRKSYSIDYEIWVPARTEIDLSTGSGDQFIDGVTEQVRLRAGSGDIEAFNITNTLSITTGSGDVKVENIKGDIEIITGSGDAKIENTIGNLKVKTGSGDIQGREVSGGYIRVFTGSGDVEFNYLSGEIELRSSSGDLRVSNALGNTYIRSTSGDIYLDGKLKDESKWKIRSTSGNVSISLPSGSRFNLNIKTTSGSIDVDFPVTIKGRISRRNIEGSIGSSNSHLICTTTSGNIRLRNL
ncbi:MAG: DUF4097 domain-containing protein [Candidatus Aminicenantia bacterium]